MQTKKERIADNLKTIRRTVERLHRTLDKTKPKGTEAKHVLRAQQEVALLRLEIGDSWPDPDVMDSYVFLVSEIGEVGDALIRANHGHRGDYSRNNPRQADLNAELGDVFLMLCTLATCLDIDLDSALQDRIDHFKEKYGNTSESSSPA